ncbi:metallo-beta-lactamase domain-containing protein [Moniliophthora roreri MCA 2997]|uniref:Metallo-beta-lactamase domain-containing protein n=1 Tax=Moniliophthora roreri (strain MCA 2997) TaxID=1381753 RepID=V2WES4_MONRO|nr:metallo-beta-lactamase domain-containing protein [Moniliophthora roreri MCA 2997]
MEKIEALASITRLSPGIVRVLAQNPGKFTLQGTNTYLIGKQNPYTLIDTGEGLEEYIPVLEKALKEAAPSVNPNEQDVSDIIISHWHRDHVGGLPSVLATLRRLWDERKSPVAFKPPRLHKFPVPTQSFPPHEFYTLPKILESLPKGSFTPAPDGSYFHDLRDLQSLTVSSTSLRVLHTPGHTVDSICLYIPDDKALYTADTVLGQGTAVFEDLGAYIASLRKMKDFYSSDTYSILYPGHGPVVTDGVQAIETYIKHRLEREVQVLKVLQSPPPAPTESDPEDYTGSAWTTWKIVGNIYAAYPESLWLPASNSIYLHMQKLEQEGLVKRLGGKGVHTKWGVNARL